MLSATADRAGLGAQPVQSEPMNQYRPLYLHTAGASIDRPTKMRFSVPLGRR